MGEFLAGVAITLFGLFIYKKIKESKERKAGGGSGGGGGGGSRPDIHKH